MKSALFKGLLVFSLLINAAVFGTLLWCLWLEPRPHAIANDPRQTFNQSDFRYIRNMWKGNDRAALMETRRKIQEKKLEVLDLIAGNPGDLKAVDKNIDELLVLRARMERTALAGISKTMAELPDDKRQEFLSFLKNRACGGPGMGMGHGRGRGHGFGPGGVEPCPVMGPEK